MSLWLQQQLPVSQMRALHNMLALLIPIAVFINVFLYVSYATNPLVVSDAWYFIDAFLARAYEHGFTLADLYVKRSLDDHAQPLQKLILLLNAKWFHLDFVVEAFVGLFMALCMFGVLFVMLKPREQDPRMFIASTAAIAASLVSLNSGMIYNWSLVTLGYLPHFIFVVTSLACWTSLQNRSYWAFALAFTFVAFTLDTMATIAGFSLIVAVMLALLRSQASWRRCILVLATIMLALGAYWLVSRLYLHAGLISPSGQTGRINSLLGLLSEYPGMLVTILGSSVVHLNTLKSWFGDSARNAQVMIATIIFLAHIWFWRRAWAARWNGAMFTAICMMLMMYLSAVAIIVSRVPTFGTNYLHEPRYVLTWQMSVVALALMAGGSSRRVTVTKRSAHTLVMSIALLLVVLIQWPLSAYTWNEARYLQSYVHTMARQMYLAGVDSSARLASCVPMLTICNSSKEQRVRSIEFLKRHHLNVYSEEIRRRYSLEAVTTPPGPPMTIPDDKP